MGEGFQVGNYDHRNRVAGKTTPYATYSIIRAIFFPARNKHWRGSSYCPLILIADDLEIP